MFPSCFGKDAEVQLLDEEAPNLKSVLVRAEAIPLEPKQAAERLLKALKAAAGDSPVNVAAGVGPSSLEALRADVQGLRLALERGLVMGRSKIFVQGQQPPAPQGLDLSRLGLLGAIFQSGNAAALRRELLGMFREWDEAERPQRWIEQALRDLVRLFRSQNPDANEAEIYRIEAEMIEELASAAKFPDLFDTLAGLFEELLINPVDKDGSRELIDEVCRYLETVLAAPVSIENLAARFNIGPASLARAFRKHRGVTPLRFLINLRIAEAKNLMSDRPELGIKDIAEIVGYPDQHYFSRIFKSMTGMSPSMFRESVEDKPGGIHAAGSSSLA